MLEFSKGALANCECLASPCPEEGRLRFFLKCFRAYSGMEPLYIDSTLTPFVACATIWWKVHFLSLPVFFLVGFLYRPPLFSDAYTCPGHKHRAIREEWIRYYVLHSLTRPAERSFPMQNATLIPKPLVKELQWDSDAQVDSMPWTLEPQVEGGGVTFPVVPSRVYIDRRGKSPWIFCSKMSQILCRVLRVVLREGYSGWWGFPSSSSSVRFPIGDSPVVNLRSSSALCTFCCSV